MFSRETERVRVALVRRSGYDFANWVAALSRTGKVSLDWVNNPPPPLCNTLKEDLKSFPP